MPPKFTGIDHVHVYVYVSDRSTSEIWYRDVLGFVRVKEFEFWAKDGGPLTVESADHNIHLALFERPEKTGTSTTAFGTTGEQFLNWKAYLECNDLELRINDHTAAFSMYFSDPDQNMYEITTYDHDMIRAKL